MTRSPRTIWSFRRDAVSLLLPLTVATTLALAGHPARALQAPTPVSPGTARGEPATDRRCPVFSWAPPGVSGDLRLEVHRLRPGQRQLVLSRRLPPQLSHFAPAGADCLAAGDRYQWSLVSLVDGLEAARSPALGFSIRSGPSEAELDAALGVLASLGNGPADLLSQSDAVVPAARLAPALAGDSGRESAETRDLRTKRARVDSAGTASGMSIASDGTVTAATYVAVVTPQLLTDVVAVDLSCNGCVDFADVDLTVLQNTRYVDCGPDGWLRQLNSPVCETDSPSELTAESTLSPVDGRALITDLGPRNAGYALCALTRVEFQEIEGSQERARCDVDRQIIDFGESWHLKATTTDGADAHCSARCFR